MSQASFQFRVGVDRVGVTPSRGEGPPDPDRCPLDGERGVFRRMALLCPRCGKLLGGI